MVINNLILPEPTLRRLPWYLAYVEILKAQDIEYVSSTQISRALNVDASQIAKDLSFLSLKGKTRIGYEVNALVSSLADFLGFRISHKAYIFGAGSLGKALMLDSGLANYGLDIVAGFDIDNKKVGNMVGDVPIYHIDSLATVMESKRGKLLLPSRYREPSTMSGRRPSRSCSHSRRQSTGTLQASCWPSASICTTKEYPLRTAYLYPICTAPP